MARFKRGILVGASVLASLAVLMPLQAGAHGRGCHDYYDKGPSYHHNGNACRYNDDDRDACRSWRGQEEKYSENRGVSRDRMQPYRDSGRPCYTQDGSHHYRN